jgi:hypothetical protein
VNQGCFYRVVGKKRTAQNNDSYYPKENMMGSKESVKS